MNRVELESWCRAWLVQPNVTITKYDSGVLSVNAPYKYTCVTVDPCLVTRVPPGVWPIKAFCAMLLDTPDKEL